MALVRRVLQQLSSGWRLPLEGLTINQFIVDQALTLVFAEPGFRGALRIETDFELISDVGSRYSGERLETLCNAIRQLLGREVVESTATNDGTVILRLHNNLTLVADGDPFYEAWEFDSSEGAKVVSVPGMKLAVWREEDAPELDPSSE